MTTQVADRDGIVMIRRNPEDIRYAIIHHSATDEGNVAIFRKNHIEEKKFSDIGYHYVICNGHGGPDGKIQEGRHILFAGAHAVGRNDDSVGICLVGDFTKTKPTSLQMEALYKLLRELMGKYPITFDRVLAHKEVSATECPGSLDVSIVRKVLAQPPEVTINVNGIVLPAIMMKGKAYAPVRELIASLNYYVEWDAKTQTVIIKSGGGD